MNRLESYSRGNNIKLYNVHESQAPLINTVRKIMSDTMKIPDNNSLIYTIPNFVNSCIYAPVEHFPVLCRWSSRVIHMCIRTRPELLTIHILLREKNHFFLKFFMYQAPVAWSKLPVLTKSCKTIKTFNYHVKRYFINVY